MIIRWYSIVFFYSFFFNHFLIAQQLPKSPRLCIRPDNPSQYYPCVLNHIGLKNWSVYRCSNGSIFDETSQKCLVKLPISDTFDVLTENDRTQFQKITNFFIENNDKQVQSESIGEPSLIKKLFNERLERAGGVFWSNGYPLLKLDDQPVFDQNSLINSKLNYFSSEHPYPVPVSEDELKYKKICYFTNWAQYRTGPAKFEPEAIDPFLCTHIIYAFAYISNQTYLITKVEENDEDLYRRINGLKKRNTKLKTLLGIGGWNMKSHAFSVMVHDPDKRRKFIFDTINFLHKHNFDGFEADWEYPGIRGGQADDKYYLTSFFQEFKEAAIAQSIITGQSRLLLAAAVAANQDIISNGYEIEKISKVLDFINIMTYDFHGAWQNRTGLNAPLYRRFNEMEMDAMFNQDFGISIWLKNGAPAHKLVLGIPLFARTFLLARKDQNELHSPTIGNGTEGPFTRSAGFLSYFEVCLLQSDPAWTKRAVVDGSESGYMFKDRDWISYDTIENIQKRAAYVVANNLGGLFVWSLDMDDFSGAFCNNGSYPYIKNSLSLLPTHMSSYI